MTINITRITMVHFSKSSGHVAPIKTPAEIRDNLKIETCHHSSVMGFNIFICINYILFSS